MSERKKIMLSDIPKGDSYSVPEEYFENLSKRIMQRIEAEEQKPLDERRMVVRRSRRILGIVSLAAAMALFFGLGRYFMLNRESSADAQIAALSDSEIIAYLEAEDISPESVSDMPEVVRSADELSSETLNAKDASSVEQYLKEEGF